MEVEIDHKLTIRICILLIIMLGSSNLSKHFASKWLKPDDIDLTKLLNVGESFNASGFVTLGATTNRTKKPGDEIFSTPAMIHKMNKFLIQKVNMKLPQYHAIVTNKVTCQHKAPLSLGAHYNLSASVSNVTKENAEFRVICDDDMKKVIGQAIIKIGVIRFE
ncbi:hypothetical protein TRFO_32929 [Tritrichomonas foetus]|uniref:Fluoroacetyl-CoA-specific thioesterase-like domain-containing protein n=1 Tax=Tritrichomonas foetus TaxID=1144522 RepID=A0A1J4JPT5_9EUKA|nr:hypothetical protein TRFO_32929 [Tritrichomonas foetus]|eukprot:OHT00424.1 hypothetical protein TRFO_32929 [Tritrichomonas foetus]